MANPKRGKGAKGNAQNRDAQKCVGVKRHARTYKKDIRILQKDIQQDVLTKDGSPGIRSPPPYASHTQITHKLHTNHTQITHKSPPQKSYGSSGVGTNPIDLWPNG